MMPLESSPPAECSPLLVDLYELTMADAYLAHGYTGPATFSLFARKLPRDRGYLLAAGLGSVLSYLEALRFDESDLGYLSSGGRFSGRLIDYLQRWRFGGAVRALPEGTPVFPHEPLLEVTAPLPDAQLVESAVLNQVHLQTVVASKVARCVLAAAGKPVVDFSLRRVHGYDAGLKVARAGYIAGLASTSNVLAGRVLGVPVSGTMAHSFIQAFPDELTAFRAYAASHPVGCVLLIDTYDTIEGARRAAVVGRELAARGGRLEAVRLDSGDLAALARSVRAVLDDAGLPDVQILASGGLDEHAIARVVAGRAPIDVFCVGTKMGVSADAPYLDMAYKLVAYAGRPVMKLSAGKATWPGPKQVWRRRSESRAIGDAIGTPDEAGTAGSTPLLETVMHDGVRTRPDPPLAKLRERVRAELAALPAGVTDLTEPAVYPVTFSESLMALREDIASRAGGSGRASE